MSLTLAKETGAGLVDANCYADVADGDAYHECHLYAASWVAASPDSKAVALTMATLVIDAQFTFRGWKRSAAQALQWPRVECPNPDVRGGVLALSFRSSTAFFPDDAVPQRVIDATCELARELLKKDRTLDPAGAGLAQIDLDDLKVRFSKSDVAPIVPDLVRGLVGRLGDYGGRGGTAQVRLMRV